MSQQLKSEDMKRYLLITLCMLLSAFQFLQAQEAEPEDSIIVSYETPALRPENAFLRDLMEFQGIQCIDVTVKSTKPITYTLYQVNNIQGKETRKSIEFPFAQNQENEITFRFMSQAMSPDTARIVLCRPMHCSFQVPLSTTGCILMETISDKPYSLTGRIPLIAYTPGHKEEVELNGIKGTFVDYCGVRDAHKHPTEWHKLFNIGDYIYFELEIQPGTTPQFNFQQMGSPSESSQKDEKEN